MSSAAVCSAGVFDGHGGSMTAAHAAETLHHVLYSTLQRQQALPHGAQCHTALHNAFVQTDRQRAEHTCGCAFDDSGSTAVVALVHRHNLVVANAGAKCEVLLLL
jgi:serine/threonine protein phosphatase PrpC